MGGQSIQPPLLLVDLEAAEVVLVVGHGAAGLDLGARRLQLRVQLTDRRPGRVDLRQQCGVVQTRHHVTDLDIVEQRDGDAGQRSGRRQVLHILQ